MIRSITIQMKDSAEASSFASAVNLDFGAEAAKADGSKIEIAWPDAELDPTELLTSVQNAVEEKFEFTDDEDDDDEEEDGDEE